MLNLYVWKDGDPSNSDSNHRGLVADESAALDHIKTMNGWGLWWFQAIDEDGETVVSGWRRRSFSYGEQIHVDAK